MGKHAADALAASIGKKGKIAWIYHDAQYYVTNQRDQAFKKTIEQDYPDMKIVAEQGMADPARAEEIAQAMVTQHPDLDGIYVTWAEPALSVLSTLRSMLEKQYAVTSELLSGADLVRSPSKAVVVTADLRVVENIAALNQRP